MKTHAPLGRLLEDVPTAVLKQGETTRPVLGITHDSRRVGAGELFVAVPGARHDARRFIGQAVARGAAGIVAEGPVDAPAGIAVIRVPSARAALADLAAAVYGHPARRLRVIGVTGTDGKTTTSHLVQAVLERAGRRTGRLSTLGMTTGGGLPPAHFGFTTPEAGDLQRMLAEMIGAGCESAVLEVSSHALHLDRVRGIPFRAAVFTNLSPEHLDLHGTTENYAATKARLFEMATAPDAFGVVNADDPASRMIAGRGPEHLLRYAVRAPADVTARHIELHGDHSTFALVTPWGRRTIRSAMPGRHNVLNWLAAAATALALGAPLDAVADAAADTTVDGRLQEVAGPHPFRVFVDFAHTPHALATVLRTLRDQTPGRLLVLFGHSGGRDAANRRPLGATAIRLADFALVTNDNPAPEDPGAIAAELVAGARSAGGEAHVCLDRGDAIRKVLAEAQPGDTVLLAGKGHETYQDLPDGRIPWSDTAVARHVLTELGY